MTSRIYQYKHIANNVGRSFSVKNKFSHAYPQDYPYRINNVLECEFFLLEMMVSTVMWHYNTIHYNINPCHAE